MAEPSRRRLVLASASPFRRRMLEAAGLSFEVMAADVDEAAIKRELLRSGSAPTAIAQALAAAKAESVSARLPEALVIGADQVLALGPELFSKPVDVSQAREQLLRLRGRSHQLHTAAALAIGGKAVWSHVETATLTMRPFSEAFLADYLARGRRSRASHRRRLRDRGPGHPAVRPHRGRHLHHHRLAAAAAAGRAQGARSACGMIPLRKSFDMLRSTFLARRYLARGVGGSCWKHASGMAARKKRTMPAHRTLSGNFGGPA